MARSLRRLTLLAAVLACGWVAAPALSADPYLPAAVDFEQPLPAAQRIAELPTRATHAREVAHGEHEGPEFRSPVVSAPERFDLAGLAGELRPIELRAREDGGEWTEWVETANGDPVYFGGAEQLQLRAHGWRPRGRLHYVNVSGTTSAASGVLSSIRRTINTAYIDATGALAPDASAAPVRPEIVDRAGWGAEGDGGCPPREAASYGKVKGAAIHHTVSSSAYTELEAPGIVLGICRYHRNANGWNDIGYNALVDRFGNIYEGRDGGLQEAVIGAHTQGYNAQSTGVASIGTHTRVTITPAAREAFVSYLAWKLANHGIGARGKTRMVSGGGSANRFAAGRKVKVKRLFGHGRVGLTACPGEAFEAGLGDLRRAVQERIDASGGPAPPAPPVPAPGGGVIPPPAQGAR